VNAKRFRVMKVDLSTSKASILELEGREQALGGSGLCAMLFERFGLIDESWDHPGQPLIFAIGPLTGYFPLMSKTVCAFRSPYHNQYTESHAGGRSALGLRFAGIDALVITGRSERPCILTVGSRNMEIRDAHFLWGMDVIRSGRIIRRMVERAHGHRSILRIGPAGENLSAMACINADTYRHFGRLGAGSVMGVKKLKAIVIMGDSSISLPEEPSAYKKAWKEVYRDVHDSGMMHKYHDLGTPANLERLNQLKSLPWRNLKESFDPEAHRISGETFAAKHLLRNLACSGCPVGCIHVGFVREKFMKDSRYYYLQMAYDYEPIFAVGSMLGIKEPVSVLKLIEKTDRMGLDVISAGVALAWATEAIERGIISKNETLTDLSFGDASGYLEAVTFLAQGTNRFYRLLAQGTLKAAENYGGSEFACVLGQEMAGYATGELFFTAQSLGFRHSHLDTAAYSYEQKHAERDLKKAISFLLDDELSRCLLNSMVACLFSRKVYTKKRLAQCLESLGYVELAQNLDDAASGIRASRWKLRFKTGFDPESITIPRRFLKVVSWKGPVDADYLSSLKKAYGDAISGVVQEKKT